MEASSGSLRDSSLTEEEAGFSSGGEDATEEIAQGLLHGVGQSPSTTPFPRTQPSPQAAKQQSPERGGSPRGAPGPRRPSQNTAKKKAESVAPRDVAAGSVLGAEAGATAKANKVVRGRWVRKVKGIRVAPAPRGEQVPILQGHKSTPVQGLSIYQIERMKRHFGQNGTLHTEARKHIIERWTHTHLVLKLAIIAVLAVVLIILGALSRALATGRLICATGALLFVATLVGIRGAMVVVRDIQRDDDGLETPGQRMLQLYFHIGLAFVVLFLPFAIGLLRDPSGYEGDVFATLTAAGDDLLIEEAERLHFAAGFIGLFAALVILTSLQSVVKIVTFYEITQSFLETFSLTIIACGITLIYLLLSLFKESQFLSSDEAKAAVGIMDSRIMLATVCTMLVVGMSIVGFFAAWFENRKLLLVHAFGMGFLGVIVFTLGILILSLDWPSYVQSRCYMTVKTMSADWWSSALQCTKYGGTSIGALVEAFDDSTSEWVYLINGVGSAARCADSSQYAVAWEYAPTTMGNRTVDLVGCVNLACCTTLSNILSSMSFTTAFAFTLLVLGIVVVVLGDLWLRRETIKDQQRIKIFSRSRAFWIVALSALLTLVAIIVLASLLKGNLGRTASDLIELDDIRYNINKTALQTPLDDAVPHSCSNQVRDGAETDVDCGGVEGQGGCPSDQRCRARQKCLTDEDCMTDLVCDSYYLVCVLPPSNVTCSNGKKDVLETDVDCGGPSCTGCGNGLSCMSNSDCYYLQCEAGACISCSDGIKNGEEADVDCGSQACVQEASLQAWAEDAGYGDLAESFDNSQYRGPNGLCLSGARCTANAQCEGGLCIDGSCASCSNGLVDGDETDVDCGGSHCTAKCEAGGACASDDDCRSGTLCDAASLECTMQANLTCAEDGIQNNDETDVDCGGTRNSCSRCAESKQCLVDHDCASGICYEANETATCASCSNGIQDGDEAGVDCGGSACATRCSVGDACGDTSDCASGLFCWNQINVEVALQHYLQSHDVESEAAARADLEDSFPTVGTCQVPFSLTVKALSPVFYMQPQVQYGDLFETELNIGLQLSTDEDESVATTSARRRLMRERLPRRRLRQLSSAAEDGYAGSLEVAEADGWPYLCNLTVTSVLSPAGNVFQVVDDGGASITTWRTSTQVGVEIVIQHEDRFPLIYVVPTTCAAAQEVQLTTQWTVDSSCEFINVDENVRLGLSSLLVPLLTTVSGFVRSSACSQDASHVDCMDLSGVTVTLRAYRAGLCGNIRPLPFSACDSVTCSQLHHHECVADTYSSCCYWTDNDENNVGSITSCLDDSEEFVQAETYSATYPGLYILTWPELFSNISLASSHQVLIQFAKDGYADSEAVFTVPVGGYRSLPDVYMYPNDAEGNPTSKPSPVPTPPPQTGIGFQTANPTPAPTLAPSLGPTDPTVSPTSAPTGATLAPTDATSAPSTDATLAPTDATSAPSTDVTLAPSTDVTLAPASATPAPTDGTSAPSTDVTSAPTDVTSAPTDATSAPSTDATTSAPSTAATSAPTGSTPSPTETTPAPVATTPAPTIGAPTSFPTSITPTVPTGPGPTPVTVIGVYAGTCEVPNNAIQIIQNRFDEVTEYSSVVTAKLEVATIYTIDLGTELTDSELATSRTLACQLRCQTACSSACVSQTSNANASSTVAIATLTRITLDGVEYEAAVGSFNSFLVALTAELGVDINSVSVVQTAELYASATPNLSTQYTTEETVRRLVAWANTDLAESSLQTELFANATCEVQVLVEVCTGNLCSGRGTCDASTGICVCEEGYHGYQCQETTWPFARDDCVWEKVYAQDRCVATLDKGDEYINGAFAQTGLMRYDRFGEPYGYYERLSDPTYFDAYGNFLETWSASDNLLHKDFRIFTDEASLGSKTNTWQYCGYDTSGRGFPETCGPETFREARWCSRLCADPDATSQFASITTVFDLYICSVPDVTPANETTTEEVTGVLSGTVVNEGGLAVAATVKLFKGTLDLESAQLANPFKENVTTMNTGNVAAGADEISVASSLDVAAVCYPDSATETGSAALSTSSFVFGDLAPDMYTVLVIPDNSAVYGAKVVTGLPYNAQDTRVVVPTVSLSAQVYLTFEYDRGDYGDLELVVNFQTSDDEDADECSIGVSALEDGACSCGGVQVASIESNAQDSSSGRFTQSIIIETLYKTVYRFFLRTRTSASAGNSGVRYRTDGRCGINFPLESGRASQCPTEEILWDDGTTGVRPCCSQGGYCGSSARHCSCQLCMDYRIFEEANWESQYRVDGACRDPLQPYDEDGNVAICPPGAVTWWNLVTEARPCCNEEFQCGNSVSDCTCPSCVDYRAFASDGVASNSSEAVLDSAKVLEESNAVVTVTTAEGSSSAFELPAAIDINYQLASNGEYGDAGFVRLFCIDATSTSPAIYEYGAPRYFSFESEMMALDIGECPGSSTCEFISVSGIKGNDALNGIFRLRYNTNEETFKAFPGYDVSTACSTGSISTVTNEGANPATCYRICELSDDCDGFVYTTLDTSDASLGFTCRYVTNITRCGGKFSSKDIASVVYLKTQGERSLPTKWYTHVDTLFSVDGQIHLYRDEPSALIGGMYTWFFDTNLNPEDGYLAFGVDAMGTGTPDGVVQWLVYSTAWSYPIFLAESALTTLITTMTDSCDMSSPSMIKNFSTLACSCSGAGILSASICSEDWECGTGQNDEDCRADPNALLDVGRYPYELQTHYQCGLGIDRSEMAYINFEADGCDKQTAPRNGACRISNASVAQCMRICDKHPGACAGFDYERSDEFAGGYNAYVADEVDTGRCHFRTDTGMYFSGFTTRHDCYFRQPRPDDGAICKPTKFPADEPGTDFGCPPGFTYCGEGRYDPSTYTSCASESATSSCSSFQIRFAGTNYCLTRTRWSIRVLQCDPTDTFQEWTLTAEGYLVGQGVSSQTEVYTSYYYAIGVNLAESTSTLIVRDPGSSVSATGFEPVKFRANEVNELHGALDSDGTRLCFDTDVVLGLEASFHTYQLTSTCSAFEIY